MILGSKSVYKSGKTEGGLWGGGRASMSWTFGCVAKASGRCRRTICSVEGRGSGRLEDRRMDGVITKKSSSRKK